MGGYGERAEMPENCDCCGHDAEDCGMDEEGWVTREAGREFPGNYCFGCASLLRLVLWSESCASCGVEAESERAAERDGWRYFQDKLGQLVPLCPSCTASVFGIAPPAKVVENTAEDPRRRPSG